MATPSNLGEVKAQEVAEASRDPNSNVTAEDAEKKLVEEAKKAGAASFSFDPNASPEQKAAQARANIPEGFHHQRKSKGVAIVTDIDDGTPGEYNLPDPEKARALAVTTPAKDKDGEPLVKGSGQVPEDDYTRWVERTGWAPRFGAGDDDSSSLQGVSMLDHQTWVESQLPDTLYGDWYHNTAVIIFACFSSWFVAVLGAGLAWVFLIMACCGTYYRTSIRRVRRNFRDDINREMSKHRLETDTESLEWINSFLVKFWPIYQPVLAETIINSVDQVLSTSTPAFLDSLRLKTFTLGTKPPRMEHVKTYPNADDDIVLMDWKFSFTPNDTADLTARQLKNKINPKVVLEVRIGKAMISKGLDVIVEDFAFSGIMRLKIKLQLPFPHVEKIEMCFLGRPEIDYVCKPLGGDMLGFDINFIPGLEGFIQEQIHGNLQPIMYEPNVFPIEVAKMLSGNAVDQAIGVVAITLHGAQGLKNPDKFSGTPDPYAIVSLNSREALAQTKIVKENANPKWNETKFIIVTNLYDILTIQIYDYNEIRKDKELGIASFPLEQLEEAQEHANQQLEVMANGKARGVLSADFRFFPVLEAETLEDGTKGPPPESNTGILKFTVEQAKDLDGTKSLIGQLNPYAVLLLNGKEVHISKKLKRTNNPIFYDASKEILITDRASAKLGLVIKDDRELGADVILGSYQIKLTDVLQLMEKGQEWYNLAGAKTGRAKITAQWKPVALTGAGAGSGGYITPIGVMRVHFKSAKDLRNFETLGKSDPYGRVLLSGIEKGRTVTFKNNLSPEWDEVLYVPMHSAREKLVLEVMDAESLGKDRTLGQVEVHSSEYIREAENGEYLVHSEKKLLSAPLRLHGTGSPKGFLNYTVSFYPCMNVADPEDEAEEAKKATTQAELAPQDASRPSSDSAKGSFRSSIASKDGNADPAEGKTSAEVAMAKKLDAGEKEQGEVIEKKAPKLHLTPSELVTYESGLVVFKLLDAELSHSNVQVEVLVDDMAFPSYVSSRARSKRVTFDEIGDCFVRELDFSKLTLRLREKADNKGDGKKDHTHAQLTGNTLDTLKQCLNNPTILKIKNDQGDISNIRVSLKYIPVKMQLDPSESINNMGKLRVDVLDASNLPSADRNGYSDPYCKFELNGQTVFKTKVQKKTLHPAWNEFFEVDIPSRAAADFKCVVYDWDFGDKADLLGSTQINLDLLDPFQAKEYNLDLDGKSGTVRLRLLFRPDYVTRSRQGSSTFSGTFATPGKVVAGVAGAPIKGVLGVGHGVGKAGTFILNGIKGKKRVDSTAAADLEEATAMNGNGVDNSSGMRRASLLPNEGAAPVLITPPGTSGEAGNGNASVSRDRTSSFGSFSIQSVSGLGPGGAPTGVAHLYVVSAAGYPAKSNLLVQLNRQTSKGPKAVHKTKHLKASTGSVQFNEEFQVPCAADTIFSIQVLDHGFFGSDDKLGDAPFVVDESGKFAEKTLRVGTGNVVIKSRFEEAGDDSPGRSPGRKSFLGKRELSVNMARGGQ